MRQPTTMTESRAPVPRWARHWPRVAGAVAIVLGAAELVALWRGVPFVLNMSEYVELRPRTALAVASLGAALLIAVAASTGPLRRLRWPFELLALGLAALGAFESSLGRSVFFGTPLVGLAEPAAASFASALAVALCALALILERRAAARDPGLTRAFAAAAAVLGYFALLGHAFGAPPLYRPLPDDAPFTALGAAAIAVLGSGIVALHPDRGLPNVLLASTLRGMQMRWSLLAAVLAPLLMGAIAMQVHRAYPQGSVSIALMAAGTTLLLFASGSVAAHWLRHVEGRLELKNRALAAIPQGVFIVERLQHGQPNMYVNSAYAALMGYSAEDALRPTFDAASIFADPSVPAELAAALAGGNLGNRVVLRRGNGTVFPAKLSLNEVPRADGSHCVIGLIEDVTAEELATKQRLELLAETAQARKDAEAANKAKDSFFASMSHELRSPLNACVMWLDVLALGPPPDKVAKAVDALRRNLGRQTRLVNDLIDAAKIASGGIEVHLESVELGALLERNVEAWRLLTLAKQQTLEHRFDAAPVHVAVDADRLVQVLKNLMENAVDSTPPGGRIGIALYRENGRCHIEVADTGPGLSPEAAADIFTPSWRAEPTTRARESLRLGLAVAHHLVAKHGGTLSVTNKEQSTGTVFTIALPLAAVGTDDRRRAGGTTSVVS